MSKVLFCRVDRIGDLVLTLPMEQAWKSVRPNDEVYWLVDEKLDFLFGHKNNLIFFNKTKKLSELVKQIKNHHFETCLCFHVPFKVAFALCLAKVRQRIGVASQWYSWLFYNKKIRQKRSQALKNEAYYNLDLVNFALNSKIEKINPLDLKPDKKLQEKWKLQLGENYIVLHPGMAGSARNWPESHYLELAKNLLSKKYSVVITGSLVDVDFIEKTQILKLPGIVNLVNKTPSTDLIAVLSLARAVIVPSTGVAHLSASLGVKTLGIYSPVKVQAPLRWGPIGKNVNVFTPTVDHCPGWFKCLEEKCSKFDCMKTIEVETIVRNI